MRLRLRPERAGGVLLAVVGAWYALYAHERYALGTIASMGPGMFPLLAGVVLVVVGGLVLLSDCRATEEAEAGIEPGTVRAAALVLGSIVGFAVALDMLGLVPAILVTVFLAMLAHGRIEPLPYLLVCGFLVLFATAVFGYLLRTGLPLVKLPGA